MRQKRNKHDATASRTRKTATFEHAARNAVIKRVNYATVKFRTQQHHRLRAFASRRVGLVHAAFWRWPQRRVGVLRSNQAEPHQMSNLPAEKGPNRRSFKLKRRAFGAAQNWYEDCYVSSSETLMILR
jgi:hypothetical protein